MKPVAETEDRISIGSKSDPNRISKGLFGPGNNANPKGRPAGSRDLWTELFDAMRQVEKEKKEKFAHMLMRTCWDNPKVAVAMSKKFWADRTEEMGASSPSIINVNRIYLGENVTPRSNGDDGSLRNYRRESEPSPSDAAKNP